MVLEGELTGPKTARWLEPARDWLLELLARLHFARAQPRLVDRARALPQARALMDGREDAIARAWSELSAGREELATAIARERFEEEPGTAAWGLMVAWNLAARGDEPGLRAWMKRLRIAWRKGAAMEWALREAEAAAPRWSESTQDRRVSE